MPRGGIRGENLAATGVGNGRRAAWATAARVQRWLHHFTAAGCQSGPGRYGSVGRKSQKRDVRYW